MPDELLAQPGGLSSPPSLLEDPSLIEPVSPTPETQMARYTIHVPVLDNTGREIPHVLEQLRRALTSAGFNGRTVIRRAQGDWQDYSTEDMDLVMIDAPDNTENLEAIKAAAQGVKDLGGQEAIYLTVQGIQTYLI